MSIQQPVGHFAPAPERRPRPGVSQPHTVENCDRQLQRLLRETRGKASGPLFDVWLDERLRVMELSSSARRIGG